MNTTSDSLLERLRQPASDDAWRRFVQLYTPLIYNFTCRLGVPEQDRADLVQQVFLLLVQQLPTFVYDQQRRFRGWLWTITLNQWRAARRKTDGRALQPGDGAFAGLSEPDAQQPCEAEYRDYLVGRAVKLMQAEFQQATWQAFWHCVADGGPAAAVAAELGLSVDAVYAAKSRVLRRLRQELKGLLD
jgi:RNA polymerase sigma-70 factor (ECF subfamily)